MAGHNKWSKIKRKKGVEDSRRSKIFTKILKDVTIAVRESGPDPESNPRLRLAIANAKGVNMPKDNLNRAINKASESGSAGYTEVTYEGYAPGGIAVYVEYATDNLNRTVANIRMYFTKHGGSLGTNGSIAFLFERKGIFTFPKLNREEEVFIMELIDAGADDVEVDESNFIAYTSFENFGLMQKKLEESGIETESAELLRIPLNPSTVDIHTARKGLRFVEVLEEDDDVQAVYHNMELTQELETQLDNED
ncbi:MAG: YebC/PmpR family DNA-binding transcriptional regulator [Bacteroidia bacterium]